MMVCNHYIDFPYHVQHTVTHGSLAELKGIQVFLPDGRFIGMVHDCVVETKGWNCRHLFVNDCKPEIVEDSIHVAVPWRWVRSVNDIVILRWFPQTPIPKNPIQ